MKAPLLCFALVSFTCLSAQSQNFQVIHSFSDYPGDGAHPARGSVVFDEAGNLYGTTPGGGSGTGCGENGCGSVYELSPQKDGSWAGTVIHNFCAGTLCLDGAYPDAGLVLDAQGNLYGVTESGGTGTCPTFGYGNCGVAFELSPPAQQGGIWAETVLYNFCSIVSNNQCLDGQVPIGKMIFDSKGNLYGTTTGGGAGNYSDGFGGGTVFELSPTTKGWKETVLYNFCVGGRNNICLDGDGPFAGLTFDKEGNLYGTTSYGGSSTNAGTGTVFKLIPSSKGWQEKVLLTFPQSSNLYALYGTVSIDTSGNLYSTVEETVGGVFRLEPHTGKTSIFRFNGADGNQPVSGLYLSLKAASVFGTTAGGGPEGAGNIFQITQSGKELTLHNFCSWTNCVDGNLPTSDLTADAAGNLYGTTEFGGDYGAGVVFEITP